MISVHINRSNSYAMQRLFFRAASRVPTNVLSINESRKNFKQQQAANCLMRSKSLKECEKITLDALIAKEVSFFNCSYCFGIWNIFCWIQLITSFIVNSFELLNHYILEILGMIACRTRWTWLFQKQYGTRVIIPLRWA